jgi:hypothetical protein
MCLGGGGGNSYDAYKTGDEPRWQTAYQNYATLQQKQANGGKVPQAQLNAALNAANSQEGKVDKDAAARLDVKEYKRQSDIKLGNTKINKDYTQFNPAYYGKYQKAYTDFYNPQIDDQYAQARGKLTAALAGRGNLESTAGINQLGQLQKQNDIAKTTVANQGQDAVNTLKSNVEKSKSDLVSLNASAADPSAIDNRASGEATALAAPPAFSPIGQVFSSFLAPLLSAGFSGGGGYGGGQNYQSPFNAYRNPYPTASGGGSGTVYSG